MDTDAHERESDLTQVVIGEYAADLGVDEKVIVELNCVDRFANEHLAQCINYLGITFNRGAAHQLPEAQGGMETSPPGSLISYIRPTTVLSSYFVDTTLDVSQEQDLNKRDKF